VTPDADRNLAELASVVVCARNRAHVIADTLRAVAASGPGEVVVIDDGSTDGTAAAARAFTDRVIRSNGAGPAAARQLGAESASCPYVVYVDSDVVLAPGCLADMIGALEMDRTLAAASATMALGETRDYWARAARRTKDLDKRRQAGRMPWTSCSAVAIRRDLILEFRFDPFFSGAAEDMDFFTRLVDAGWGLCRSPFLAYHHEREGAWATIRRHVWYGRGRARLAFKLARLPHRGTHTRPAPLLILVVRERHFDLLPYCFVSGAAYRAGFFFETAALRIGPHTPA